MSDVRKRSLNLEPMEAAEILSQFQNASEKKPKKRRQSKYSHIEAKSLLKTIAKYMNIYQSRKDILTSVAVELSLEEKALERTVMNKVTGMTFKQAIEWIDQPSNKEWLEKEDSEIVAEVDPFENEKESMNNTEVGTERKQKELEVFEWNELEKPYGEEKLFEIELPTINPSVSPALPPMTEHLGTEHLCIDEQFTPQPIPSKFLPFFQNSWVSDQNTLESQPTQNEVNEISRTQKKIALTQKISDATRVQNQETLSNLLPFSHWRSSHKTHKQAAYPPSQKKRSALWKDFDAPSSADLGSKGPMTGSGKVDRKKLMKEYLDKLAQDTSNLKKP